MSIRVFLQGDLHDFIVHDENVTPDHGGENHGIRSPLYPSYLQRV